MSNPSRFNIRVYGLLKDSKGRVLLTHEARNGFHFCKFPGGGLEFGEGIADGLKREFLEELLISVRIVKHLYTTDFFQQSQFNPADQIISIYYWVESDELDRLSIIDYPAQRDESDSCFQCFWVDLSTLKESELTFPIDKFVLNALQQGQLSV